MPTHINTSFGWVIGGSTMLPTEPERYKCNFVPDQPSLDEIVSHFWKVEEYQTPRQTLTEEEQLCEQHYENTVAVGSDNRITVRLTFKESPQALGQSYVSAAKRSSLLERRLKNNQSLKESYVQFMREYITTGHMSLINDVDKREPHFFIPHHCVLRPQSLTTKLRVVFDASAKSSSGVALNEILMVGPTIQQDLITTLLSFRLNRYALSGDISKMYRQFVVDERDRKFQLILWRENDTDMLQIYQLNTVTYGVSAAPFLAIRSLFHIAKLNESESPLAAAVL
ncbi:uncharacterized protein [Drosophila takahashii]|uniref:uncharacterized protein n=1 Tax=Drosophila takahashii TaxID=29030 RepID=UPI003898E187